MTPLLEVLDVHKHFGGVAALNGCSLSLRSGEVTGLIGPNGAGKTTLLNVISGLLKPDSGAVQFDGHDVVAMPMHRVAELGLIRTFQLARELSGLTVLESLLVAAPRQRGEAPLGALLARATVKAQEQRHADQARRILKRIGLWKQADQSASALSGGQKKLLELGRTLMLRPKLVLLDEPAAGVSPPLLRDIAALISELKTEGISFAIVEHDMHLIGAICDHVHVLAEGRTLLSGGFVDVIADARVVEAYLGLAL